MLRIQPMRLGDRNQRSGGGVFQCRRLRAVNACALRP